MFDADYKRMKREKQAREDAGFVYYSLELLRNPDDDCCYFEMADPDMDVEQTIFHKLDMEKLRAVLRSIPEEERLFILDCFDAEWGARKEIAEKYGITIGAVKQRKRRILKKITKLFLEG